jgi:hypothetical protein
VRSDDSQKFVNSPRRIPTVHSSLAIPANEKVFLHKLVHLRAKLRRFLQTSSHSFLALSSNSFEGLILPDFSYNSVSFRKDSCVHSLRQISKHFKGLKLLRPCTLLQQQSLNALLRFTTLRLHSACALLARLLCLSALLWK